jgi:RNA polymerase sigma factor (TIGR02999 family)
MEGEGRKSDVTRLLEDLRLGDPAASERIFEAVYAELRQMAERSHRRLNGARTLQPTALVHEAWLRLHDRLEGLQDRRHFLAVAALAMRQILSNYARAARAAKRERGFEVTLVEPESATAAGTFELVALDDSLSRLAELQPRHARVVELRFLLALTIGETAEVLGVSHTTVENDWAMARAWLRCELEAS